MLGSPVNPQPSAHSTVPTGTGSPGLAASQGRGVHGASEALSSACSPAGAAWAMSQNSAACTHANRRLRPALTRVLGHARPRLGAGPVQQQERGVPALVGLPWRVEAVHPGLDGPPRLVASGRLRLRPHADAHFGVPGGPAAATFLQEAVGGRQDERLSHQDAAWGTGGKGRSGGGCWSGSVGWLWRRGQLNGTAACRQ